jgi:hypothetical protein
MTDAAIANFSNEDLQKANSWIWQRRQPYSKSIEQNKRQLRNADFPIVLTFRGSKICEGVELG